MKEKPILFSAPMIRAIQNTKPGVWPAEPIDPAKPFKSQTRRIVKPAKSQDWLTPEALGSVVQMVDRGDGWWAMSVDARPPGPHGTCPGHIGSARCPYQVGDIPWVRETLKRGSDGWLYAADDAPVMVAASDQSAMLAWAHHKEQDHCVSIHMPRWACRFRLEVMDVRAQRLHDITEEDAKAEGCMEEPCGDDAGVFSGGYWTAKLAFDMLWEEINGKGSWGANPWVWAYTFKRLT